MGELGAAQKTEAYDAFAYAYDAALGSRFFAVLQRHLDAMLERFPPPGSRHLDVACGTGHALEFFRGRAMRSAGVDASVAMLAHARQRNAALVGGDMRALPFRGSFDLVTSFYDSLNHLLEPEDLAATFRSVRALMHERSLFWFDMNHPSAYTNVWSIAEPFVAEESDYRLEIDTMYDSGSRLATGIVSGWRQLGDERIDIRETHHQRSYSEREVKSALAHAGMRVVHSFRFNPFDEDDSTSMMKMFFVAATR